MTQQMTPFASVDETTRKETFTAWRGKPAAAITTKWDEVERTMKTAFDQAGDNLDLAKVTAIGDGKNLAEKCEALIGVHSELSGLEDALTERTELDRVAQDIRAGNRGGGVGATDPTPVQLVRPAPRARLADLIRADFQRQDGPVLGSAAFAKAMANRQVLVNDLAVHDEAILATLFQTTDGWAPESVRDPGYTPSRRHPIQFIDILPRSSTTQELVRFMAETTYLNAALPAAPTASGYLVNGLLAKGATSIVVDTGSGTIPAGSRVRFGTAATVYTVKTAINSDKTFTLTAGLAAGVADDAAVTVTGGTNVVAEGAPPPESTLRLTQQETFVRKIATHIPVTREEMEDEPQVESYLNETVPFMVRQATDQAALMGDGAGTNIRGLLHVTGIQDIDWTAARAKPLNTLRKAKTLIRFGGRAMATHYVLNPSVWDDTVLSESSAGGYYYGSPQNDFTERVWGLPVVLSDHLVSTKASGDVNGLIGDFSPMWIQLRLRRELETEWGYINDDWAKEILRIKASIRLALVVKRPQAFATISMP